MKIIAIERAVEDVNWENQDEILREEAAHVLDLKNKGIVTEIYFSEEHNAILFLECDSLEEARQLLNEFPLVKAGMITFEIHTLLRYDGFDRLIN